MPQPRGRQRGRGEKSDGNFIINPGSQTPLDDACKLFVLGTVDQIRTLNRLLGIQPSSLIQTTLMIQRFTLLLLSCLPMLAHAQDSIDDRINAVMEPITNAIMSVIFFTVPIGGGHEVPFVFIWLLAGALIFTLYNRFVNITAFGHALDVVRGKFDDPNHKGEVSHFQALDGRPVWHRGCGQHCGCCCSRVLWAVPARPSG